MQFNRELRGGQRKTRSAGGLWKVTSADFTPSSVFEIAAVGGLFTALFLYCQFKVRFLIFESLRYTFLFATIVHTWRH